MQGLISKTQMRSLDGQAILERQLPDGNGRILGVVWERKWEDHCLDALGTGIIFGRGGYFVPHVAVFQDKTSPEKVREIAAANKVVW